MNTRQSNVTRAFKVVVPLDAQKVEGFSPDQPVKVVARGAGGRLTSAKASFDRSGKGSATLTFKGHPGALRLWVGPGDADDDEMVGLQTLVQDIPSRLLATPEVVLPSIRIPAYWWAWWRLWCRTFTVRGRVVCPDGSPVPGAVVCAFDVDRWLFWTSRQQVGCATTDIDGTFSLTFRWCCGWWPWWWLRYRFWTREPLLVDRFQDLLGRIPELEPGPIPPLPSLSPLSASLEDQGIPLTGPLGPSMVPELERLRETLVTRLPVPRDPDLLQLWPWTPWHPWHDCAPDLVFRVTQDCVTPGHVILDEGIGATRWNVPQSLEVTLVASQDACCRTVTCPQPPCDEGGECVTTGRVCTIAVDQVGGNLAAPAAPAGYLFPGAAAPGSGVSNADRPFAGVVGLYRTPGELLNVDAYELEMNSGSGWGPVPDPALPTFYRRWLRVESGIWTSGALPFAWDATSFPGHTVVRTVDWMEANGPFSDWAPQPAGQPVRFWNDDLTHLGNLQSAALPDGTHRFRVVGWQISGGGLTNRRVLPFCGSDDENEVVLSFSNTPENPDVRILQVRIDGQVVGSCGTANLSGTLEVDFRVRDAAGFLASYSLMALYGTSQSVNLLSRPGASVVPLAGISGWAPGSTVGAYGRALGQGAVAPSWEGGLFRLTVPVSEAFPEPCCYLLDLWGYKRNVLNCSTQYLWRARDFFTVGVGVCGPVVPPAIPEGPLVPGGGGILATASSGRG